MTINPAPALRTHIRATEIGEYIRHQSCERRFKLEINNRELARQLPFAERLFNPLDPVLQEMGHLREEEWAASLIGAGIPSLSGTGTGADEPEQLAWEDFIVAVAGLAPGQCAFGREVSVAADLGAFHVEGRLDFILVLWAEGQPRLRLVECKASRKDRTYHRIQLALYRLLVQHLMQSQDVRIGGIVVDPTDVACVVARIDEATNTIQPILDLPPLSLEMEEADVLQLLAPDGALAHIVASNLDDLEYQLDKKCDGCVFSVHCFPESARQRRLELLSLEPSAVRTLRDAGVTTIDDLAILELPGPQASQIQASATLPKNLKRLREQARSRRRTLPEGDVDPDAYEVGGLSFSGKSQLPEHTIDGQRLVRVYLGVHYDYTENRIGGISAHVTISDGQLHTGFVTIDERTRPDPLVKERLEVGRDDQNRRQYQERALSGQDVIVLQSSPWTGDYATDTAAERDLLQQFFATLAHTMAQVAEATIAPIHFYVWARSDLSQLIEGCSRAGTQLLRHLQELLGCREGLEQLIYSCLEDEIDRRYALGWTGRGLSVVISLQWFGRRYHWVRRIGDEDVSLDRIFTQDIFDFKTDLDLRTATEWAEDPGDVTARHKFEIRSRFYDSLSAPYWRAYWGTLPDPRQPGMQALVANAIRRYNQASGPEYLPEYLRARTHALRWIEERVTFKNAEIEKPLIDITNLPTFTLGVTNAAEAALDFLRLDQHVKVTNWIAQNLNPPADRLPLGRTLPLRSVQQNGNNQLVAQMNLEPYGIALDALEAICAFKDGDFVRITICSADPQQGQTFGQLTRYGATCTITRINWQTGAVRLSIIPSSRVPPYTLSSLANFEADYATIDESVTDFVASRVDKRLDSGVGRHVYSWFDLQNPSIPACSSLDEPVREQHRAFLSTLVLPRGSLAADQQQAILSGLEATVQLLQGPPGTGKTTTTAVAILERILVGCSTGDVLLVAANTHTAVDTLLQRIDMYLSIFRQHAQRSGLTMPEVVLTKVHSSDIEQSAGQIEDFPARRATSTISRHQRRAVMVIGGTTSAVLKMGEELNKSQSFGNTPNGFQASTLIVDEASMMVFPHFLALATLVAARGQIMLTGDHRQLSPIVAHDWEREDRPPVVLYQPYVSSYDAVLNIRQHPSISDAQVIRSALSYTFRLPSVIRELISRLYRLDNIDLQGPDTGLPLTQAADADTRSWDRIWEGQSGLYLITHSERQSKQRNELEVAIIQQLLAANEELPQNSVAIITPHRAQRSVLQQRLNGNAAVGVIDTVERLQGGERPVVIVSATASDPAAIAMRAEFILSLNRSNVAFSRAQQRLIVVCSEALLSHIPSEVEHYEAAMLWKSLRTTCSHLIATERIGEHTVRIFTLSTAEQ